MIEINKNEDLLSEKNKLYEELEKSNSEKEKYKKESKLYLEEVVEVETDYSKLLNELNKLKEEYQNSNKKLEKINKENLKLREEKNFNLKELENYRNACQLPTDEKTALLRQNNQLSIELQRANSELTKCRNELALNLKLVRYVSIENRINEISNYFTCCGNKCINSNLSEGTCNSGHSFIRVQDDGIVNYHSVDDTINNEIGFYAENSFTKAAGFCCHYSLFYFEITMLEDVKDKL
ncbi:unnamed protein product [Meloidogyne enterolobii]|uniref:Uncharacterized protein n=1 Tax=Meloidogyne enterolobii TaxID=390850 RepID=A0ACB1ALS4_MELEN